MWQLQPHMDASTISSAVAALIIAAVWCGTQSVGLMNESGVWPYMTTVRYYQEYTTVAIRSGDRGWTWVALNTPRVYTSIEQHRIVALTLMVCARIN